MTGTQKQIEYVEVLKKDCKEVIDYNNKRIERYTRNNQTTKAEEVKTENANIEKILTSIDTMTTASEAINVLKNAYSTEI